jgi:hypothetical protein
VLPKDPPAADADDREPAALADADGSIELFWSSNRDGSRSIWRNVLNPATDTWGTAEQVTHTPYSQRNPLAVALNESTLLVYRCNASVPYRSNVYTATETVDFRYAGSTTADTRNAAKIALRGQFEDFQTYTYDVGRNGERTDINWYAEDTVGLYLTPDTEDPTSTTRNRNLIKNVLQKFLPIQVRVVFIIEPAVYKEAIYTYDLPSARPQRLITEQFLDRIVSPASENYSGLRDSYRDTVPGWVWVRSWSEAFGDHHTVDFTTSPIDTTHRTWHTGVAEPGE